MGWGENIFSALCLLVSAGVTSHLAFGFGTRRAKELFAALVLALIVGAQYFHLVYAATYIPATRFYTWNPLLHRTDCIESGKGGKRRGNDTTYENLNPCFCNGTTPSYLAQCYSVTTGLEVTTFSEFNTSCPTDGTAKCKQGNGHEDRIHRYVPSLRDCRGGQLTQCTMDQPCTPCERSTLSKWKKGRCKSCSSQNDGNCNFVPGVGPYCLVTPGSKEVQPCKQCCTEPEPFYTTAGYCY